MIKSFFTTAWRNLIKHRTISFINIGGLSVGLAVAILIMLWAVNEYSYDQFHTRLASIHLMMQNENQGGQLYTFQSVPGPLAAALRSEIPEVKVAARMSYPGQQLIGAGEKRIYENGIYAEPDYFKIMTFPVIEGNPEAALRETGSVVITERTAKKLFGNEAAVGKLITHNNQRNLKVGAVIKDVPENSSFKFDVVLPFAIYEKENSGNIDKWDNNSLLTWVALQPGVNLEGLNKKLAKLYQGKRNDSASDLFAYPLAKLAMYGRFKNGRPDGGRIEMIIMLSILGIFVLLIACINFMNLTTARSERRAREVGVRKSLGASKKGLVLQFLSEAFLMTFLALVIGVVLAQLLLPGFNSLTDKNISFPLTDGRIWLALLAVGVVTGLLAGSYPAFFLSRFQPVKVLKGVIINSKGGSLLRKGLVTFQFVISIFLIIVTIVVYRQVQYAQERETGYNQENLIELPARGDMADKFKVVKNELLRLPAVKSVSAGSDNLTGFGTSVNGMEWPGKTADQNFPVAVTRVQYDWTETAGLTVTEGRDFSPGYGSDTMACLLNESAVKKMGLKQPVTGTVVDNHTVIGVVADFVYNDAFTSPGPLVAYLSNGPMNHFFVRLQSGENFQKDMAGIEKAVKATNPAYPFEFHVTKEEFQKKFTGIRSGGRFASVVGVLAIIVSCLGLFALSAFVAERRKKEIGVRKVLGASAGSIWMSLSKDFLAPVFLAFVLASPLAFLAMQKMLSGMEYHIGLSWWMFAAAGLLAVFIAVVTVSFQGIKAAVANPANSLRTE